jgi:hypothetical protein
MELQSNLRNIKPITPAIRDALFLQAVLFLVNNCQKTLENIRKNNHPKINCDLAREIAEPKSRRAIEEW